MATVEAVLAEATCPLRDETNAWPAKLPLMTLPPSERDEIKQRLANFKAHQRKMQAEREDYYMQTMTRTRAAIESSLEPKAK